MRNFVNYALLFFFLILAVSGLLSFFEPFKLLTTRIHIVFGFGVVVLVLAHIVDRLRYFSRSALSKRNKGLPSPNLLTALILSIVLLAAAAGNWSATQLRFSQKLRATLLFLRPSRRWQMMPRPAKEVFMGWAAVIMKWGGNRI